jgi:hypothetical protein
MEGPLRIVSADSLRRLHIDAADDSVALISGFGPAKKFAHLVHLSLHELIDVDLFLSLLKQCPQLKSLEILSMHKISAASVPQYLSPDTVPLLQNLSGPWQLLGLFMNNRPVSAVTIFSKHEDRLSTRDLILVLQNLSRLSVPLLSLSLPRGLRSLETLETITSLFPALQELTINIYPLSDDIACRYPARPDRTLDTRCPVLCDDDAFDTLPADDISDAEDEPTPNVVLSTPKHPTKDEWQTRSGDFTVRSITFSSAAYDATLTFP